MNKTNAFSNLAYKSVLIIDQTANANESKITLVSAANFGPNFYSP